MTARPTKAFALTVITAFSLALPAAATGWAAWEGQSETAPQIIYSADTTVPGALFTCAADGKMKALVALEAADIPAVMAKNAPYARAEDMTMTIENRTPINSRVRLIPAIDSVELRDHTSAAKLFNAAIRGATIHFELETAGTYQANFPAPNGVFKAFADTCRKNAKPAK